MQHAGPERTRAVGARARRALGWVPAAGVAGLLIATVFAVPRVEADPGIMVGAIPDFPTQIAAGSSDLAASITVVNASTGLEAVGPLTITELTLVPSCTNFSPTCAGGAEPGVFALSAVGTGSVGTACAGRVFEITVIEPATGRVRFTPADRQALLISQPDIASELDTCLISFTISNLEVPAVDTLPNDPGVSTNQVGFVSATHISGATGSGTGQDVTTVTSTTTSTTSTSTTSTSTTVPTTTTTTSTTSTTTTTTVPTTTSTTTTVPTTTSTTSTTTTVPTTTSTTSTTTTVPTTTTTTLLPAPTLTGQASRGVPVGNQIADVARLSGLDNPTGKLRFELYGPNAEGCSGTPVFTSTIRVNGNGEYVSTAYVPAQPGTYRWVVRYLGDVRNPSLGPTPCNDPNQAVLVSGPVG